MLIGKMEKPNNSGGREDYTELMNNGYWNDLPNDHNRRYVVEFQALSPLLIL